MRSYTRKATPASIDSSRQYLLKRPELLKQRGLKIERKLKLGNCRNHIFPVLSALVQNKSGTVLRTALVQTNEPHTNIETGSLDNAGLNSIKRRLADLDARFPERIRDLALIHSRGDELFNDESWIGHRPERTACAQRYQYTCATTFACPCSGSNTSTYGTPHYSNKRTDRRRCEALSRVMEGREIKARSTRQALREEGPSNIGSEPFASLPRETASRGGRARCNVCRVQDSQELVAR